MNSGFILYNREENQFEYKKNYLKVNFKSNEWFNEEISSVLEGRIFPNNQKVIFYRTDGFYNLTGIREYRLDLVVKYNSPEKSPHQENHVFYG